MKKINLIIFLIGLTAVQTLQAQHNFNERFGDWFFIHPKNLNTVGRIKIQLLEKPGVPLANKSVAIKCEGSDRLISLTTNKKGIVKVKRATEQEKNCHIYYDLNGDGTIEAGPAETLKTINFQNWDALKVRGVVMIIDLSKKTWSSKYSAEYKHDVRVNIFTKRKIPFPTKYKKAKIDRVILVCTDENGRTKKEVRKRKSIIKSFVLKDVPTNSVCRIYIVQKGSSKESYIGSFDTKNYAQQNVFFDLIDIDYNISGNGEGSGPSEGNPSSDVDYSRFKPTEIDVEEEIIEEDILEESSEETKEEISFDNPFDLDTTKKKTKLVVHLPGHNQKPFLKESGVDNKIRLNPEELEGNKELLLTYKDENARIRFSHVVIFDKQNDEYKVSRFTYELLKVQFDYDKFTINQKDQETLTKLDELEVLLNKFPKVQIEIHGHTDRDNNTGDPEYNQKLSQGRAENIKQQLVDRGVDAKRIHVFAHGSNNPICTDVNPDEHCKSQNRRIEMYIHKPGKKKK
ncbi:OmpA family protein [Bacteriovoracaceae bacterium]|nr:OmpA family protein [Bacteriovoracaceae bacterium]